MSRTPDDDRAELDKQDLALDPEGLLDPPEELDSPSDTGLAPSEKPVARRDPFSLEPDDAADCLANSVPAGRAS